MKKKPSAAERIIQASGNGFHSRVVNFLREQGWDVLVSPYYKDNFTEKPREIDIIAQKKYPANAYFGDVLGTIEVHLFIECKYITSDTVFWFDDKNLPKAIERIRSDASLPSIRENNAINGHHYYIEKSVAKLFASEKGEEKDAMNKAINQSLNAIIYYRDNYELFPGAPHQRIVRKICYPIVVVNAFDQFHRVPMKAPSGKNSAEKISAPFQLEVDYAYSAENKGKSEYFLIDVVNFDKLADFLRHLEATDILTVNEYVSWQIAHQNNQSRRDMRRNPGM